jgi:outer membrane biosynthesis protein TonB
MNLSPSFAPSALAKRPIALGRFVGFSVAGHGAALALLIFAQSYFLSGPRLDLNQKPIHATLVRLGKQRDEKLLPRIEEPPPPPPPKTQPDAPAPEDAKPPDPPAVPIAIPNVVPPPVKAPKHEGPADSTTRRKTLFSAFNKRGKVAEEELEGDANGDPNGDSATAEGDPYWGLLQSQVKRHYDIAQTLSEEQRARLRTVARLYIGLSGQLIKTELETPSGNSLFDSAVLGAIRRAAPFNPPPDRFRKDLQRGGVALVFTPN